MSNPFPLVSIVIATYNGERFLEQQLNSLLAQDYPNTEIIAVDDCSTDKTVEILQQFSRHFPKIRFTVNRENVGCIKNFEKAISLAKGDFIATCDQDDWWQPEKISLLMKEIGPYDLVYHNALLVDDKNESLHITLSDLRNMVDINDTRFLAAGTWIPGHSILFRVSLLKNILPFPANIPHDYWIIFNASAGKGVHYVDRELVYYRQHETSTIGNLGINAHRKKKKIHRRLELEKARGRMELLSMRHPCPEDPSRLVFQTLADSYQNFDLHNNWKRMWCFFQNRKYFLAYKTKSPSLQLFYCFRMFFKIV